MRRLLAGSDPQQTLRLRRWAQAAGLYSFFFALLSLLAFEGIAPIALADWLLICLFLVGNGVFYAAIKTGFNLRFADPSLTQAQMLYGTIWVFMVAVIVPSLRSEVLSTYTILFFFGAFRLNTRRYLATAAFAIVCYGLELWHLSLLQPLDLPRELLRWGLFACVLIAVSLLGGEMTQLQRANRRQRQALEEANRRIEFQACHDELTELFNRRHLMSTLNREHARSARSGKPFVVALIDLDHFKRINDAYGHLTGDEILRRFARTLHEGLRDADWVGQRGEDTLARYGGEEFVLLLVETDLDAALGCIERLRQRVNELDFSAIDPRMRLGFSAGLAQFQPGEAPDEVLSRADSALYRAKAEGRNRSCLAA
ncbi:MAG: diguanylate cyclase [Gammaproteobacteria bacterium]|nr:diguanylate cyclase [Gammaproteobacteria bacterium]